MAEMSDYLEDELVEHIFRTASFTKPTVLAIALLTTAADDDDTGQFSTSTGVASPAPTDSCHCMLSSGGQLSGAVKPLTFPSLSAPRHWGQSCAEMEEIEDSTSNPAQKIVKHFQFFMIPFF